MSQNDFTIANQGFPAFRADLNSALQALASNSSGTSAPSTTFANMWWYDSANNIMYIRNEDNDAWIKFAELDQTNDKFVLSGTLQLDDGTVSAPALTFNSDTNMGIYRGGTDILKFVTAGTDAITIDASQGVTLAGKLDVSSGTIKLDGNYPTASNNVALGNNALDDSSLSGNANTAIGSSSMTANTSGQKNVGLGESALLSNTTGSFNTALGQGSFEANSTGNYGVAVGRDALKSNTTAGGNTAVGNQAMQNTTTAGGSIAMGYTAMLNNSTGASDSALGYEALLSNTTGSYNTAVGRGSLRSNTTASNNTAVGYLALNANTTGTGNVSFGGESGRNNTTGTQNTHIGYNAGNQATTATDNTSVGSHALYANTGDNNTAVGRLALRYNTTASDNTAVGYQAGSSATTAVENVLIGGNAGDALTTGSFNVAVGRQALSAETVGERSVAIGRNALRDQNFTSSQEVNNVAIGFNAGISVTTGIQNTLIGSLAGDTITDGIGNICIGKGADVASSGHDYSIVIGRDVTSIGEYYFTFGVDSSVHRVYNQFTSNASWTRVSDERIKKDITTNTDCGLDFINDLRTVTYKFKAPSELDPTMAAYDASKTEPIYQKKMYGFVAQEVKSAMDTHNITDFSGHHQIEDGSDNMQGISYEMFVMPLVKAVQELSAKNDALEARIATLEGA